MKQFDTFFSYNREDGELVKQIAEELKNVGINVWYDESSLKGGQKWKQAVAQYISESRTTIVFLGPSSIGKWQSKEIDRALAMNVEHGSPDIIPVISPNVKSFELPPFLDEFNLIDLRCTHASRLNLAGLIEAITQKKPMSTIPQTGREFYLRLKKSDGTNRDIKIYTLPNFDRTELLHLTWDTFGRGIEKLRDQIRNYGFRIHIDACFGINDAGLVMSTFLNSSVMDRGKIGYIRYKGDKEGQTISEEHSFFPSGLDQDPTIMLVDFEIKSGTNLKLAVNRIRQKHPKARFYLSVFAALTKKDDLKINCFEDLKAAGVIKDIDIKDMFISCTMHPPGIEPPLRLR